jgi:hypothetical protein
MIPERVSNDAKNMCGAYARYRQVCGVSCRGLSEGQLGIRCSIPGQNIEKRLIPTRLLDQSVSQNGQVKPHPNKTIVQEPVWVPGGPIALRARELPLGYSKALAPPNPIKWSARARLKWRDA